MSFFHKARSLCAGLSLHDRKAFYVELHKDDSTGGFSLEHAQEIQLSTGTVEDGHIQDPTKTGQELQKALNFCWKGFPLYLGIPSPDCLIRTVPMQRIDAAEAKSALYWDFGNLFPYPVDDAVYDAVPVPMPSEPSDRMTLLTAVTLKEKVMPILDALTAQEIFVNAIEPNNIAACRALTSSEQTSESLSLLLILKPQRFHVILRFMGNGIMFRVIIPAEGSREITEVQTRQRVREEVDRTMAFARTQFRKVPIASISLAGEEQFVNPVKDLLSGSEIPVKVVSMNDFWTMSYKEPANAQWFDAAGLALRYADENRV